MKDRDVIKMIGKWMDQLIQKPQSGRPFFPEISRMRPGEKKKKPSAKQLIALKEGRKVLLMNRQQSQK